MKRKTIRGITGIATLVAIPLLLTGCIKGITPLPFEQRYGPINAAAEILDAETAGEVVFETYDTGDGVFQPSWLRIDVKGKDAFKILKKRALTLEGVRCPGVQTDTFLNCYIDSVEIRIDQDEEDPEYVDVKLTDSSGGQNAQY